MSQIANLTGRDKVSKEEVKNIFPELKKFMEHKSVFQKAYALLSFANIVWLASIWMMLVTFWPTFEPIFKPVIKCMTKRKILTRLKNYAIQIFKEKIFPLLTQLHNFGVIEVFIYRAVFQIQYEGFMLPNTEYLGHMVAFIGCVMMLSALGYSTFLHLSKLRVPDHPDTIMIRL